MQVKVKLGHRRSYPGTCWISPVGWSPDTSWADDDWLYEDGALWGDTEEEAGLASSGNLLDTHSEGDVIAVDLHDLFWSTSGDCRFLQTAVIA